MKTPKSQMIERLVRISRIGLQDRERDVAEDAPRPRAVDLGRLDELARHLREAGVERDATNGIAPQTISTVTMPSCENVVPYQSCCKKSPRWSSVRT